jgi:RNA recognition motif-containing protein
VNIYIENFTSQTNESDLRQMFEAFGDVESVKIICKRFHGQPRQFGFVEMPSNSQADKAIKALNGNVIEKKPIRVVPADSGAKKKKRKFKKKRF